VFRKTTVFIVCKDSFHHFQVMSFVDVPAQQLQCEVLTTTGYVIAGWQVNCGQKINRPA